MDKNTVIGFILIGVVLVLFVWFNRPSEEQIKAQQRYNDSVARVEQAALAQIDQAKATADLAPTTAADTVGLPDSVREERLRGTYGAFARAAVGTEEFVTLENDKVEVRISTKGGRLCYARLKEYTTYDKQPLVLFDGADESALNLTMITANQRVINTADLYFTPSEQTDSTVTFTATAAAGKQLVLKYRLGKDYLLHAILSATGMDGILNPNTNTVDINWQERCAQQEKGFTFENRYATLTYHKTTGGTDYLSETSEKIDEPTEEKTDWVAFKNQFFSAVIIAKNDFQSGALLTSIPQEKGSGYLKHYQAKLKTFFDPTGRQPTELDFYYGPNDFRLLQQVERQSHFGKDLELQRLVYLGWPLFRIINRWFTLYVFDWLTGLNINMGIVLILITLLLKLITYPLVKKSYMSSAKMRVLKPKLDAATREFDKPEDQMKKQQAMMSEYAKYGVSPLSGCLPMLIQMPIWIAMFNFVPNAIQLRGQSFLWISDLSTYDPIIEWNTNLWLLGDHLSLTCILFCVANVLYSMMTMRQQRDQMVGQQAEQMKMMQWMMYFMPVMFFFMFNDYSSGLNFYYFISLFFSAAIMWMLRKTTNDEKLLAILEVHYQEAKDNPQKLKGLAARLQAMQEQQQEMQRRREQLGKK